LWFGIENALVTVNSRIVGHPEVTAAKRKEPLESRALVGAVAIAARLIFSTSLCLLT
jgi:hypothetical protein